MSWSVKPSGPLEALLWIKLVEVIAELFQILKDVAVKVPHSIYQQIWKLSSGHRTGKGQFSFQSQRRAMAKNIQTIIQLCLFHMLARLCSKSFKLGFNSTWTENVQIYKVDFEETEEPEIKLPTFVGSRGNQGNFRNTSTSASLTMLQPLCGSKHTAENS